MNGDVKSGGPGVSPGMNAVAVAAPHPAAAAAAADAVRRGGNAVDAALAAAVMLTVVYPHQNSVGGDLIAVLREPDGQISSLMSVGAAAGVMDAGAIADEYQVMPGRGPLSITVPGVVAGWQALALRAGSEGVGTALRSAAETAESGTPVASGLARAVRDNAEVIRADAGLSAFLLRPGGHLLEPGDTMFQPALAETLRRLATDPSDFYRGRIGEVLTDGIRMFGSPLTSRDFEAHRAEFGEVLQVDFAGFRWSVGPPPGQGVALAAVLSGMASGAAGDQAAILELCLRTAAVRDSELADPRLVDVDLDAFFAASAHRARPADNPERDSPDSRVRPRGDTVAVTAVDSDGLAVSIVQSLYQSFGSGYCEPGTGIILHNRGSAFSLDLGRAGALRAGARPPHTLTPVIATAGEDVLALGCQGGRAQPWILAQLAADLADPLVDSQDVIGRDRWVFGGRDIGCGTATVMLESGRADPTVQAVATAAGMAVLSRGEHFDEAGHVQLASRRSGLLQAATDPRADGHAVVVRRPTG